MKRVVSRARSFCVGGVAHEGNTTWSSVVPPSGIRFHLPLYRTILTHFKLGQIKGEQTRDMVKRLAYHFFPEELEEAIDAMVEGICGPVKLRRQSQGPPLDAASAELIDEDFRKVRSYLYFPTLQHNYLCPL